MHISKSKLIIKYFALLLMVAGVVVALFVLGIYWVNMGGISSNSSDWGAFGAVLGGVFTLLGAFATVGTLLLLYQQLEENTRLQEENRKAVDQQLSVTTFDHYIKHRTFFMETLDGQVRACNGCIKFLKPEDIYNVVFPKNNPTYCNTQNIIGESEEGAGLVCV